jgi:hypothetical protein
VSKQSAIKSLVAQNFRDRDAGEFAVMWLECFYASEGFHHTMQMQTKIFTNFGNNEFFLKNREMMYPICAHALMSYAEGTAMTLEENTRDAGVLALMQGLEPVVHAARISGERPTVLRKDLMIMLNSPEFAQ